MENNWGKIGAKLVWLLQWCWENHPGKSLGLGIGFLLAVLFIILGFWQTILLFSLSFLGFYCGKCWDQGGLPLWLTNLVHRIIHWKKR
ncbi:MAG TPA: DUF2273 domain-containing protein [Peptococcaceae bacterium]|nr:DUF2273 domain-containing protein [Peptococcaceae bacterium]